MVRRPVTTDHGTTHLLNRLNLPAPTRGTVMEVPGDQFLGAVGQGRVALFRGLELVRVNGS
jgi:hypothetical protein